MAIVTTEKLGEAFSLALEYRAPGYVDLVSNANVVLMELKKRKGWKDFTGPTIRHRLMYAESGSYVRYAGYDYLSPTPVELINDAEFTPKLGAVSVTLSGEDILKNSGSQTQLENIMEVHMDAAERELEDRFVEDLHSAGSSDNQIGGLQVAVPTTVDSGSYGGISRASNAIWRTFTYNAHSAFTGITQVNSTTVRSIYNQIMFARSRGKRGPDLLLASAEHYGAYDASLYAIQRINDTNGVGAGGFESMKYYGSGRSVDVVLEGGIGSAMPADTTYLLHLDGLAMYCHPDRKFTKIGNKQMPVNQDAIVQHIGFYGEFCQFNPLHNGKMYDGTPAS